MAGNENDSGQEDKGQKGNAVLEVEIGGEVKKVTAEDYTNLVNMQKGATDKSEAAAAAIKAAERYGVSVKDFVEHAEGTMGAFTTLVDQGVIDNTGKVISSEGMGDTSEGSEDSEGDGGQAPELTGMLKKLSTATKALENIEGRMESVEKDQLRILHRDIHRGIKEKHPSLTDDDVNQVFSLARKDRNKDIWAHAEDRAKTSGARHAKTRAGFAKEFGINLEEFDANKVLEQDPAYGTAGLLTKGKKLSFQKKKGQKEGSVTPRQATQEYFDSTFSKQ